MHGHNIFGNKKSEKNLQVWNEQKDYVKISLMRLYSWFDSTISFGIVIPANLASFSNDANCRRNLETLNNIRRSSSRNLAKFYHSSSISDQSRVKRQYNCCHNSMLCGATDGHNAALFGS